MNHNTAILGMLVAWFALLALVEAVTAPESRRSVNDSRLVTNFGLTLFGLIAGSFFPLANVGSAAFAERLGLGFARAADLPWWQSFGLTLAGVTFAAYWVHRWMHRSSIFWRVHRVHHADSEVDVSTSLRNHPLELLVTLPASAFVILVIGPPASAVVAVQTLILFAAIWQHADVRLPPALDRWLATILVTPRLHRLHHSPERAVHDSNYGDLFTIWDWMFGTLNLRAERGEVGLRDQPTRPDHLFDQICSPLRAI